MCTNFSDSIRFSEFEGKNEKAKGGKELGIWEQCKVIPYEAECIISKIAVKSKI